MRSYEEIGALKARLEKENVYPEKMAPTDSRMRDSPSLLAALRKVEQVAPTDSTVLIHGETGTA